MKGSKLYVGNLGYAVTNEQLKELFGAHGEVVEVNIIQGKGFGFVQMGDEAAAEKAKTELNGKEFEGRTLKIDEARPPKPRSDRGGSGGGYGEKRGGGGGRGGFGRRF